MSRVCRLIDVNLYLWNSCNHNTAGHYLEIDISDYDSSGFFFLRYDDDVDIAATGCWQLVACWLNQMVK